MRGAKRGPNRDVMRRGRGAGPGVGLSRVLGRKLSDGKGRHGAGTGATEQTKIAKQEERSTNTTLRTNINEPFAIGGGGVGLPKERGARDGDGQDRNEGNSRNPALICSTRGGIWSCQTEEGCGMGPLSIARIQNIPSPIHNSPSPLAIHAMRRGTTAK